MSCTTSVKLIKAIPFASKFLGATVDLTVITGAIGSTTVTVTWRVRMLPAKSTTLTLTTCGATTLAQLNVESLKITEAMPQLSAMLEINELDVIEAKPLAPKVTVRAALAKVKDGLTVSKTVTAAAKVVALPSSSVAVTSTLFTPRSVQLNTDLESV